MLVGAASIPVVLAAQDDRPVFRAAVERVTLSATVRTDRGRPVTNLKPSDFQLYDSGQLRTITEMRTDPTPVSLGLLVDFSGSMDVAARRQVARENVRQLVELLTPGVDSVGMPDIAHESIENRNKVLLKLQSSGATVDCNNIGVAVPLSQQ